MIIKIKYISLATKSIVLPYFSLYSLSHFPLATKKISSGKKTFHILCKIKLTIDELKLTSMFFCVPEEGLFAFHISLKETAYSFYLLHGIFSLAFRFGQTKYRTSFKLDFMRNQPNCNFKAQAFPL